MEFIGREQEQKIIHNMLQKDGYQGCVIYGRRRMGKTELVRKCVFDSALPYIIYQCKESTEHDNLEMFTSLIRITLKNPYLAFDGFLDAVRYLFEYSKEHPMILVLDEYPYLRTIIDGCDSKIQNIIDDYSLTCNMKFFLLGSSISTMEDVLSSNSPLYMRFQSSLLLKQMDYYDSSKFYPGFSNEDKVRLYSAFGGVPYYNAQIDEKISARENIIRLISGQFSGLREFLDTYLKQELRKVNNANVVFESIALGAFHYSDIFSKSHVDSSPALNTILQKLIKMDLIEYVSPINNKNDKQKSGYRISDYCVRFYYNYIYRNESAHQILDDDAFYDHFIHHDFETSFIPKAFEEISKQFLIRMNKKGNMTTLLLDIGTYWYDNPKEKKKGLFDVVGKTKDGYVFFECKYKNEPIDESIIEEEITQVSMTSLKPVQYGFISKSGFRTKKTYPYLFYTLDDMYQKM